jgi:ATP-binding cassette subfamily F protein uup
MRLLMGEPNVLILDEPTNDLDIDTLTALEDLLDGWPGTLVVVSHDRYFVERVCDNVFALTPGGGIRHVPGGIEQYLTELTVQPDPGPAIEPPSPPERVSGGQLRAARKELARVERELDRLGAREAALAAEMVQHATDAGRLSELTAELEAVRTQRAQLEADWLEQAEVLES